MTSQILLPEIRVADHPDRLIIVSPSLTPARARALANEAVRLARQAAPKINGAGARRLQPVFGKGVAGIRWADAYMFYIDHGIGPFTMRALAGKLIPMWVEDPGGFERQRNPKIKIRHTVDGRLQVLIFRRAAALGRKRPNGSPASYPGAPGRIGRREAAAPWTTQGRRGGAIAAGNVGVRWRHPGITGRQFMNHGLAIAAQRAGIIADRAYLADVAWRTRTGEAR
jgi:hypothetical protein